LWLGLLNFLRIFSHNCSSFVIKYTIMPAHSISHVKFYLYSLMLAAASKISMKQKTVCSLRDINCKYLFLN